MLEGVWIMEIWKRNKTDGLDRVFAWNKKTGFERTVEKNDFTPFYRKSIFYVISPPSDCVAGFKIGKGSDGSARLKSYQMIYDENAETDLVIVFKKRSKDTASVSNFVNPENKFESLVKRKLKDDKQLLRGTEWYKDKGKLIKVIKDVLGNFDFNVAPRRESDRIKNATKNYNLRSANLR